MRISTGGSYALRAMVDSAQHGDGDPVSRQAISERQEISAGYLAQLFTHLQSAALVERLKGPGGGFPDYDLRASPENKLLRLMTQTWPDQIVALAMDDPLFSSRRVPINSDSTIYVGAPKLYFDMLILLPVAQLVRTPTEGPGRVRQILRALLAAIQPLTAGDPGTAPDRR